MDVPVLESTPRVGFGDWLLSCSLMFLRVMYFVARSVLYSFSRLNDTLWYHSTLDHIVFIRL